MIIETTDLTKIYRRGNENVEAIKSLNFTIEQGEFICLLGHSGAGKTTTLNLLGLMDSPTRGTLSICGRKIVENGNTLLSEGDMDVFRRNNVGFVFQQFYLIPTLTALENVQMPFLWTGKRDDGSAESLLKRVGLSHRITHYPSELSGGEMQRVAVARALINSPKILLADEPTGNLDTKTRDSILDLFGQLKDEGLTVILATHDIEIARFATGIFQLQDGVIIKRERGQS